jgi:hypothetical protein
MSTDKASTQGDVKEPEQKGSTEQSDKTEEQKIPYSRFKEILDQKNAHEAELKKLRDEAAKKEEDRRTAELKQKGDYETLMNEIKSKEESKNRALKDKAKQLELERLAIDHKILKPEYINIFNANIEIDDNLKVTNMDSVKKDFEAFKKDNPSLFASADDKKPVPKTDNQPFKKQTSPDKVTSTDRWGSITKEVLDRGK